MGLDIYLNKVKEPGFYKANGDDPIDGKPTVYASRLMLYPKALTHTFYDESREMSEKKVMKKFKDFVYTDTEELLFFNKELIFKYYSTAYAGTALSVEWDYSEEVNYNRFWIKEYIGRGKPDKILYESKPEDCIVKECKVKCLDFEEHYLQRKGMKGKFYSEYLPQ